MIEDISDLKDIENLICNKARYQNLIQDNDQCTFCLVESVVDNLALKGNKTVLGGCAAHKLFFLSADLLNASGIRYNIVKEWFEWCARRDRTHVRDFQHFRNISYNMC